MIIFWILAILLALQSAWSLREGFRFLRYARWSWRRLPGAFSPRATLIIPCKGKESDFDRNLGSFLAQDYPCYETVFVLASENDPAYAALAARLSQVSPSGAEGCLKAKLVVAGYSEARGEKVNNLRRGLEAADPAAEVLVFADIDARPGAEWLRSLVSPLSDPGVTVSTGFRWYLPGAGFVSQLRAAWDTSITMHLGDHERNIAWGGSMAIRAADFKRLDIAGRYWARTVSDDYAVTRAVRDARGRIRFEPRCLVASREDSSFGDFLSWSNRQIILTRVYAAPLWALGLVSSALYAATFLCGLVIVALPHSATRTRLGIVAVLAGVELLGLAKACLRSIVAREIFPEEGETLAAYGSRYWQLAPLVPWIMLVNFLAAGFTRRIEWRGVRYELRSADDVRVLGREEEMSS